MAGCTPSKPEHKDNKYTYWLLHAPRSLQLMRERLEHIKWQDNTENDT